jgi:hypothetical protein
MIVERQRRFPPFFRIDQWQVRLAELNSTLILAWRNIALNSTGYFEHSWNKNAVLWLKANIALCSESSEQV